MKDRQTSPNQHRALLFPKQTAKESFRGAFQEFGTLIVVNREKTCERRELGD